MTKGRKLSERMSAANFELYHRGRAAGARKYWACACPVIEDDRKRIWLAGWVRGLGEGGHRVPREVECLLTKLRVRQVQT